MAHTIRVQNEAQKVILDSFNKICQRHQRWRVWQDFVTLAATEISTAVDRTTSEARSKMWQQAAQPYNEEERGLLAKMFADIVNAMEEDPDQDFLGELFMRLELGNDYRGQFFTPYNLCVLTAKMSVSSAQEMLADRGWITVNDPACGAGALLIALANLFRSQGVNYQNKVLFVAQDIDFIAGCMCYIQLSLLGCAGYVTIDDTLARPQTAIDGSGLIPVPSENIWYTPMYFREEWQARIALWRFKHYTMTTAPCTEESQKPADPEAPKEAPKAESAEEPKAVFAESKHGQLTLF